MPGSSFSPVPQYSEFPVTFGTKVQMFAYTEVEVGEVRCAVAYISPWR